MMESHWIRLKKKKTKKISLGYENFLPENINRNRKGGFFFSEPFITAFGEVQFSRFSFLFQSSQNPRGAF